MNSIQSPTYLRGPVALNHLLLQNFVQKGSKAIDATCGNGKDTLLLAQLVGAAGHVFAFDVQKTACLRTSERIADAGMQKRVTIHQASHELIADLVPSPVAAIIFNLGWLPGGDRSIITNPETTIAALKNSLTLLQPSGLLTITCYPGHGGGDEEARQVSNWAAELAPNHWHVWRMGQMNVATDAPFCIVVQKVNNHADA